MIKFFFTTLLFFLVLSFICKPAFAWDCKSLTIHFTQNANQPYDETLNLQLINSTDSTSPQIRDINIKRKTTQNQTEMVMVKILKPNELQGLSMLTKITPQHKILQWLYLPQNQQTKRILDSQKKANFAGSEFSYSDLMPFDWRQYSCESVLIDTFSELQIRLKPLESPSAFTTLNVRFDPQNMQLQQIQFLDAQEKLIRTATFEDYRSDTTKNSRPFRITMQNELYNRKSILKILNIMPNRGLKDSEFSLKAMTR